MKRRPRCTSTIRRGPVIFRCRLSVDHDEDHRWWGGAQRLGWTDRGVVVESTAPYLREGNTYPVEQA